MNTTTTNEIAPVTNLRETKRQMAASRKAHPAGKQTPAKAPAKAPAKKAPAGNTPVATKIAWKLDGEKDAKGQAEGTGTCGDREYRITGKGDSWKATVKQGGKTTTIAENVKSGKAAWQKCVDHNKSAA
jgi:hypothetical protein